MWFKNIQLFRMTDLSQFNAVELDAQLKKHAFVQLSGSDRLSAGWIAPASYAPDVFAYANSGAMLIALQTEEKLLPASVVKFAAAERIAEIERRELRKVGKKESSEIRERVAMELLPRAFSRQSVLRASLDLQAGWIWVDSASPAKAELLIQLLRESLGSLPTKLPLTQLDPVSAMSAWLEHEAPDNFTLDADARMKAPGDGGAQVSVSHHDLNAEEVKLHLKSGKLVTQLALSWHDRIAFVLTEKLQLRRIAFLDLLQDQIKDAGAEDAAAVFDTSLTLQTLEIRGLVDAVIAALGGEIEPSSVSDSTRVAANSNLTW